jgi:hypothetical protein
MEYWEWGEWGQLLAVVEVGNVVVTGTVYFSQVTLLIASFT